MKPTSKTKTQKTKLPLNKMTGKEQDYVGAILEEMRSDFRAFGEVLNAVRERGDATYEEIGRINERLTIIELEVISLRRDFDEFKKTAVLDKADKTKVSEMETRLIRVEKHLNLKLSMA